MKSHATNEEKEQYKPSSVTALPASGQEFFPGNNEEADEIAATGGCGMAREKKISGQAGVAVQKHIIITDLGTQKKNGRLYRSYEVKEIETTTGEMKEGE